jgi:peptidylprolyl isomerase
MHLLNGLAKLAAPDDTPRFLQWMRTSPDWRIRTNAAAALAGRTTSREVRNRLVEALEDPSTHVAVSAAGALAASTDMPAREREALKEWVEDHPEKWRRAGPIFTLLGRSGEGEFLRSWLRQWEENRVGPRTRGLSAMAFVPGDEATGVLLDALDSEISRIRSTAMGGLARRWRVEREDPDERERFFDAFVRGLRLRDPGTVAVAAPVLADSLFLPLGSVDVLVEEYRAMDLPEDLEGMQAILEALGRAGSARAETLLEEVMEHPETALRTTAAEALSELRGQEVDAGWGAGEGERAVDWPALAELGPRPRLVLETEKGTVRLVLDAESAPLTVQTVAGFAREGLYDGVPFHRVVPNFVVQGGDFARGDGFGGPGFSIRSEFTRTPYRRGVVGMASAGKDTEGSQYFVTHSMQPHLDGRYTAFGWVEEGMNVVDVLYEEDRVTHARVEPGRT